MEVTVVDIRVKFWSLVWLLVKLSIAAIPALVILIVLGLLGGALLGLIGIRNFL